MVLVRKTVYKIGIIGCGSIARLHLLGYKQLENVEVTAVSDLSDVALKNAKDRWGIEHLYKDYRDLLRRNDIDIVTIAVPEIAPSISDLHAKVSVDACRAGKHVLCEKPLAQSMEGAEAILKAARKAGIKFTVGQNYRWRSEPSAVKRLIEQDAIGKIYALWCNRHTNEKHREAHPWMVALPKLAMLKQGVHYFDLFHWWLGKHARRVFAVTNSNPTFRMKGETNSIAILDYGENCIGQIIVNWGALGHPSGHLTTKFASVQIEGSYGTIISGRTWGRIGEEGGFKEEKLMVRSIKLGGWFEPDIPRPPSWSPQEMAWSFMVQIKKFIEAIEKDLEPAETGLAQLEDNVEVLRTIFACYESAKTGEVVRIIKRPYALVNW